MTMQNQFNQSPIQSNPNQMRFNPRQVTYVVCPKCGRPSDSIKVYTLPGVWVFLICFFRWATQGRVCCPECMRKQILIHGFTYNIITGNFLWLLIILPWSIINLIRTYSKGHSREVYGMR